MAVILLLPEQNRLNAGYARCQT